MTGRLDPNPISVEFSNWNRIRDDHAVQAQLNVLSRAVSGHTRHTAICNVSWLFVSVRKTPSDDKSADCYSYVQRPRANLK